MPSWKLLRRWASLAVAAAYLLQGTLLVPLHQIMEASPHKGCEACNAHDGTTAIGGDIRSLRSVPQHSHPIHDENSCGLCASVHRYFTAAKTVSCSAWTADVVLTFIAPTEIHSSTRVCLPDSRGPPCQPS